jgi:SCY1-like protein 1
LTVHAFLSQLRHPNILQYRDSHELVEKGNTVIYLITQPVTPLKQIIEELKLEGKARDEYLAMVILHMTATVSFLNNDAKLIHGGICLDAVMVTTTLDPKLHFFDLLSEHLLPGDDFPLSNATWMIGNQYKPAELGRSEWDAIRQSPPYAVDSWGLGCLIQEICSNGYMTSVEALRNTEVIPPALLGDYQKLLSSVPSRRLNPSKLAECKFLQSKLVDVVSFMENIAVKDSIDKEAFFKRLPAILPSLPQAVAVRKILPLLSSALEFGGAPAQAVGSLMVIGNQLQGDEFTTRVVPTLSKLFASTDRGLRRSLLETIDTYGQHLTPAVIEEQIYPQLQTGFSDANAYIRELTLKSMLILAPKLSNKTLTQSVLKHLSKLQIDEEPSIRANTTVLLGNISKYLGEGTCKRVLLNAFTRALKDSFPPAKGAGLRAIITTAQYYSLEDAALRILPAATPLCIDPVPDVRSSAIQCVECFMRVVKENDVKMCEAAAAAGPPQDNLNLVPGSGTNASVAAVAAGSVLNWAVSSLITSTGLAVSATKTSPTGANSSKSSAVLSNSTPTKSGTSNPGVKPSVATAGGGKATSSGGGGWDNLDVVDLGTSAAASQGDGWDADEAELERVAEAEAEAERLARARLTSKHPMASKPPAAASGHVALPSAWAEKNEEEVWEDMAAEEKPKPKPRPKKPAGGGAGGSMKLGTSKLGASKLNQD